MTLTSIDLFSGIGGFTYGFEKAGIKTVAHVEKNEHSMAVLRRHWPDTRKFGDITDVTGKELGSANILAGGFPCQDLSVANQARAGLAGSRSGLWSHFERLIGEINPTWVVFENVPGLLSANGGRDFAAILRGLENRGCAGIAWRVLDSQYHGVAQRRRRVFLVANLREREAPAKVLFEPESVRRDTPPSRQTWEKAAGAFGDCPYCGGVRVSGRLTHVPEISHAVNGQGSRFGSGRTTQDTFIIGEIPSEDTSNAVAVRDRFTAEDTLIVGQVAEAVDVRNLRMQPDEISGTLQSKNTGGHSLSYQNPIVESLFVVDGKTYAPVCTCQEPLAVSENQRAETRLTPYTYAVVAGGGKPGQGYQAVLQTYVRKLTEVECERLQGFPDGHTAFGFDENGKYIPNPMTRRYTMLGNAVTTNVLEWIGKRIVMVEEGKL